MARFYFSQQPPKDPESRWNTKEESFVGTAVRKDGNTQAENQRTAHTRAPRDARQRSKHKRSAGGSDGSAPIAVHPITRDSQIQRGNRPGQQRPSRGHPRLQHPEDGG